MPKLPSVPRPKLPSLRLPGVALPEPVKSALAVLGVLAVFFGPHAWMMASAVTDVRPFGELPAGSVPDVSSFTSGYGERPDESEGDEHGSVEADADSSSDECVDDDEGECVEQP